MPVRGGWPHSRAAMDSLPAQTFRRFEILAIDDGMDDRTRDYALRADRARLHVVPNDGSGVVAALNKGLARATGAVVARQDADDISEPHRFETQLARLHQEPHVDLLACCARFIDDRDRPVSSAWTRAAGRIHDPAQSDAEIRGLLPLTCCIVHGSVLARTSVLRAAGGYDARFECVEDYELWLRLLPDA